MSARSHATLARFLPDAKPLQLRHRLRPSTQIRIKSDMVNAMDWLTFRRPDEARAERDTPPSVTELLPELLIGEYPRPQDAAWLRQTHGVTAVLSLQDDDDLKIKGLDLPSLAASYEHAGIAMVRIPVPDASADHLARALESVLAQVYAMTEAGGRVYLHCNAGINRAPTAAIAFIHVHRTMALKDAVNHVRKRRVCAPYTVMLEEFFARRAGLARD
jgi:protein-tyrosine phosphatase